MFRNYKKKLLWKMIAYLQCLGCIYADLADCGKTTLQTLCMITYI